ncbi:MAG: hypothetical protein LAO51_10690 [Acidobacteriia bacterium]|nr:hypothetical protein [Terriglobia bacterium]
MFYRNEQIETQVESRLTEYERLTGRPLPLPTPIDLLAERLFNLAFLWDEIEELPGEVVWGAIRPQERLIVLNERHKGDFLAKPGLERSTKGHEIGHWDLFVDKATLEHPVLFDHGTAGPFALRTTAKGMEIVILLRHEEGRELLRQLRGRADEPDEARAVNRYAAALSMPRELVFEHASKINRTAWRNLYPLAELFGVTISALRVRLEQLNLLYVAEDGSLFESRERAFGQGALPF